MRRAGQFSHVVFPRQQKRCMVDLGLVKTESRGVDKPSVPLDEAATGFVAWLFGRAGIDWRSYRADPLRRRLPACLRALRVGSFDAARRKIETNPSSLPVALTAMLLGVTELFRDWEVFERLGRELARSANETPGGIRVWSSGCSAGAELYSVAILLSELGLLEQSTLLGTDCRGDALARAAEGRFLPEAVEQLPQAYRSYFEPSGQSWQICGRLREKARWQLTDIVQMSSLGCWDVILFRNVAMYFEQDVADALLSRMEHALRPGGLLILGKAERPHRSQHFSLVAPCIYRRAKTHA